jgi:hypothetical protein
VGVRPGRVLEEDPDRMEALPFPIHDKTFNEDNEEGRNDPRVELALEEIFWDDWEGISPAFTLEAGSEEPRRSKI